MEVVAQVGERLVRFRAQAGLDFETAAAAARIAADRLDAAESGDVALTEDELARLASAYGVGATELFGGRITPIRDFAGGA